MTTVVIHHDHNKLPPATTDVLPVQIYGLNGLSRGDIATIGNPVVDKIRRLGVPLSPASIDFLTIALAVTAADTFVLRQNAADGWSRDITLQLPLCVADPWRKLQRQLEKALHFLSGDIWRLEFSDGGYEPPEPYSQKYGRRITKVHGLDCVCLFSGGLDSAIGAIDLLGEERKPLLISHSYKGDSIRQNAIASSLNGPFSRFSVNAYPRSYNGKTDISMRTRSINFLAFAVLGSCAIHAANQVANVDIFVPENGFISLNAPLTSRRIGSLSTRTTHPYFLGIIQDVLNEVGIGAKIVNPYQFQTKGEMIQSCVDKALLAEVVDHTVSCSHWKRKNKQCGSCVPCLIRRASLKKGDCLESQQYLNQNLRALLSNDDGKDDLFALLLAAEQVKKRPVGPWIMDSGPLPVEDFDKFKAVFYRGLNEVEEFFRSEGLF